jgi:hypothetical protein
LEELIDDLNVCADEEYVAFDEIGSLKEQGWRVRQLIDGYIRYLREQKNATGPGSARESSPIYDEVGTDNDSRFSI